MARGLGEVDKGVVSEVDGEERCHINDTATNAAAAAAVTFVPTTPPRIGTA